MATTIQVIKSKFNIEMTRKELDLEIQHPNGATPAKSMITSELSSNYSVHPDQIHVFDVGTGFGAHLSKAKAHIYNSVTALKEKIIPYMLARITGNKPTTGKRKGRKEERVRKSKVFGTVKRNMKKLERRNKD